MGKLKEQQSQVLADISAINTLLQRYPVLTISDPLLTNFSLNTSIGFLIDLLEIFGVTQDDLINWLCGLLSDNEGESGLLTGIEYTVKGILMSNLKNAFSCSVDPILPDNLMKYAVQDEQTPRQDPCADYPFGSDKKNCIEINIPQIDMFGLLANCPSNKNGGVFYFDAFDPARESDISGVTVYSPNYIPSDLYKSRDFNAFLWYVINKGNIGSPTDIQKNTWDNRNKAYKKYKYKQDVKENFFKTVTDQYKSMPKIPIYDNASTPNKVLDKEQYIICQYAEHNQSYSNVLKVWLNADRYYRTRKIKIKVGKIEKEIAVNRTIFEFNYDYIYSLKLFDTKTLVANIVNSLLGLSASLSASFSFEQKLVQKKVEAIVDNIMREDDTEMAPANDCYYKFDNTTYQQMIDEVTRSYRGSYINQTASYSQDYDDVYEALRGLGSNVEKTGQAELLKRVISVAYSTAEDDSVNGIRGGTEYDVNFAIGVDFIVNFIKQTVVQIVLQVLSPKVAVLYAINSEIMGDVADISEWENFIKNFDNVIKNIVVSIKDIIVKELYNFMMEQLKPLLELLISKLALETVKYYKELIEDLIKNCIPMLQFGNGGDTTIDNVNYADIERNVNNDVEQTEPKLDC